MRRLTTITALALAACGARGATETTPEERSKSDEHASDAEGEVPQNLVQIYLLADVSSVSPGQELRLAVRLDIAPSWHIYWLNPGEAGLPTKATFVAPAGFTIGETVYPGPSSFDAGEGIISFGYHDLVLLSAPLVAPDSLGAGKIELAVEASWLACREMCIPGTGRATMALEVATPQTPSAAANAKMFASHDASVPIALTEDVGNMAWRAGANPTLAVLLPRAAKAEYFPSLAEQITLVGQLAMPDDDGVTLVLSYKPSKQAPAPTGVIALDRDGARKYYQLAAPTP